MERKPLMIKATMRRLRGDWRDQVMGDLNLTYFERSVAYWVANYITMDETQRHYERTKEVVIFCSQAGIAKRLDTDPADVSRAISALRKRRHLFKVHRGLATALGFATNEYLVVLGKRQERKTAVMRVEKMTRA